MRDGPAPNADTRLWSSSTSVPTRRSEYAGSLPSISDSPSMRKMHPPLPLPLRPRIWIFSAVSSTTPPTSRTG